MEIRLFGKSLFEAKKSYGQAMYNTAFDYLKKSAFLPDFYQASGMGLEDGIVGWQNVPTSIGMVVQGNATNDNEAAKIKEDRIEKTPKEVYGLKMLNDLEFKIKVDPTYVDDQIETFKEKLSMIKSQEFDMNRGTNEIGSMLMRLENRKKYPEFESYFEEFPYTTTAKMKNLVKEHDYLKIGEVSQFLADMPKEAVEVMKSYTKQTEKLCDKKAVFYIIANKKDFQKTENRRDPILLAQSPFGHFWQILGAWDEEMLLIEEL